MTSTRGVRLVKSFSMTMNTRFMAVLLEEDADIRKLRHGILDLKMCFLQKRNPRDVQCKCL